MGLGSAKPPGFRGWRATIDVEVWGLGSTSFDFAYFEEVRVKDVETCHVLGLEAPCRPFWFSCCCMVTEHGPPIYRARPKRFDPWMQRLPR